MLTYRVGVKLGVKRCKTAMDPKNVKPKGKKAEPSVEELEFIADCLARGLIDIEVLEEIQSAEFPLRTVAFIKRRRREFDSIKKVLKERFPQQLVHIGRTDFIGLLRQWREKIQFLSLAELIKEFWWGTLDEELLYTVTESQKVSQGFDNVLRHHSQFIGGSPRVLLELEEEGLFLELKECYPDDPLWEAQDDWAFAYGAYIEAFSSWCLNFKPEFDVYLVRMLGRNLGRQRRVGDKKNLVSQQSANLTAFARFVGIVVSCDLLTLGVEREPPSLFWFSQVTRLRTLRAQTIKQSTKLPESLWLTNYDIRRQTEVLWEQTITIREDTKNLFEKVKILQKAYSDLQRKLTVLEHRLYDVSREKADGDS